MKSVFFSLFAALALYLPGDDVPVSWDKTVHNFGDVSVTDGPLSCTFTLTNQGDRAISIFEVVSSCGCTDVKWTRESIQPGGKGSISATYKNEDGPMAFDKTLTVYISGIKRPVILRLRGVVHEKKKTVAELYGADRIGNLGLKSRVYKLPTLRQGLSVSDNASVANLGRKPLSLSFADVSEGLSLELSPNPIPAGATATLRISARAVPGRYGKQKMKAIPLLDGKRGDAALEVDVWTQENFALWSEKERQDASLPYFDQSTFSIGRRRAGEKVEVLFRLENRGKSTFHVYQADTELPALRTVGTPDIGPGAKGVFRFELDTRDMKKGEAVIMISLTTNSPLRPLINLFVAGEIE